MELTPQDCAEGCFRQMEPAVAADHSLSEHFHALKAVLRDAEARGGAAAGEQGWRSGERELAGSLERCKVEVHSALCDNVDTPRALKALLARLHVQSAFAYSRLQPLPPRRWCAPATRC